MRKLLVLILLLVSKVQAEENSLGKEVTLVVGRTWKHTVTFQKVPAKKDVLVYRAQSLQKDMTMTASGSLLGGQSYVADKDSSTDKAFAFLTIEKNGNITLIGLLHKNEIHPALTGVQDGAELKINKELLQKDIDASGLLLGDEAPVSLIGKNFEGATTEAEKLPVKVVSDLVCKSQKDTLKCTVTTESIDSGKFILNETNQTRLGKLADAFMAEKKRRQEAIQAARAQKTK